MVAAGHDEQSGRLYTLTNTSVTFSASRTAQDDVGTAHQNLAVKKLDSELEPRHYPQRSASDRFTARCLDIATRSPGLRALMLNRPRLH